MVLWFLVFVDFQFLQGVRNKRNNYSTFGIAGYPFPAQAGTVRLRFPPAKIGFAHISAKKGVMENLFQ
jgi:hypothetical protein